VVCQWDIAQAITAQGVEAVSYNMNVVSPMGLPGTEGEIVRGERHGRGHRGLHLQQTETPTDCLRPVRMSFLSSWSLANWYTWTISAVHWARHASSG
jgi:hypothetical protein